jgi:hypothetical protein
MATLGPLARASLTLLALAVCLAAGPAATQGAVRGADGSSLAAELLARAAPLKLSPDQARRLNVVRMDTLIADAPLAAERQVLDLKQRREQLADPAHAAPSADSLQRIDQLNQEIARADRAADLRAYAILTPEQRGRVAQSDLAAARPGGGEAAGDARLNALIDARVKDSKLVEFETSQAIADRLIKWAQWFALALGAPLAILALVLTIFGVRSYADFRDRLQKARDAIDAQMQKAAELQGAHEAIEQHLKDAAGLQSQFVALRAHLAELSQLDQNVRAIADQVNRIEQFVGFQKSPALSPALQASLQASLTRYRTWLAGIGCRTDKPVTVLVDRKEKNNAYYEPPDRIVIAEALAGDPDVVLREYTHHVLSEAKRKRALPFTAIQSGLSDYFPCSFNNNPLFAVQSAPVFNRILKQVLFPNGYVRNMVNAVRLDTPPTLGSQQAIGEGWGGAFWELRERLGQEKADPLLFEAWKAAPVVDDGPVSSLAFAREAVSLVAERYPQAAADAQAMFERRGLKLGRSKPRPARGRAATAKA